ncbi:MAG: hypothetical protein AAB927_03250 [Patescibacteria group bacterium]
MALGSTRYSPRTSKKFRGALGSRLALLPNFPKDTEISFKWDDDSLGKVTNHDRSNGRVETDRGGSFDPNDIKVLPPKEA